MTKKNTHSSAYIWFDTEFTDLDPSKANILQVAMVITDHKLQRLLPVEKDINVPVRLPEGASVSAWVRKHIPEIVERAQSDDAMELANVDLLLQKRVKEALGGPIPKSISERPLLAGNSIHADRQLLPSRLPKFDAALHYRMFDVSVLKIMAQDQFECAQLDKDVPELVQQYLGDTGGIVAGKAHDAYYDVMASIAEYRYYLEQLRS